MFLVMFLHPLYYYFSVALVQLKDISCYISDEAVAKLDFSSGYPVCSICGKSFTILTNARRHVKTLHLGHGLGEFQCNQCWKKFDKQRSYDDHMRRVHNVFKKNNSFDG